MQSSASRGLARRRLGAAVLLAVIGAVAYWSLRDRASDTHRPELLLARSPPAPGFLNTGPEARFVGSDACRSCHERAFASFARTGMGRSMASIPPEQAPP